MANMGLDNLMEVGRQTYRFGTVDPLISEGDTDDVSRSPPADLAAPLSFPAEPLERITSVSPAPLSPTQESVGPSTPPSARSSLPIISARGPNVTLDSRPRFSTVVRGRGRFDADLATGNIGDARSLPGAATEETSEIVARRLEDDEKIARETEIVLSETDDLERRVIDVLDIETLGSGGVVQLTPPMPVEEPREEVRSSPSEFEALQDADPPFLTDGRGRVVWSSTTAARHRESRRGRPGTPASAPLQHKAGEPIRAAVEEGSVLERRSSRARLLTRSYTAPEGVEEHSADEERRKGCITDGGGRVTSAGSVQDRETYSTAHSCQAAEAAEVREGSGVEAVQNEDKVSSVAASETSDSPPACLDAVALL
ncbi:hypothetical protein BKA93DRAFT_268956 [Sparassis latifolia]